MKGCIIEECNNRRDSRIGFCAKHYYRFKTHGDANKALSRFERRKFPTIHERFMNSFIKNENDCWLWNGAKRKSGYGCMTWEGVVIDAHRYSYEKFHNKNIKGVFVCHKCDVKHCVNPDHLFGGTPQENVADMVKKGRQRVGERTGLNKLTESQVIDIKIALSNGVKQSKLFRKYNVSRTCISDIYRGKRWAYVKI